MLLLYTHTGVFMFYTSGICKHRIWNKIGCCFINQATVFMVNYAHRNDCLCPAFRPESAEVRFSDIYFRVSWFIVARLSYLGSLPFSPRLVHVYHRVGFALHGAPRLWHWALRVTFFVYAHPVTDTTLHSIYLQPVSLPEIEDIRLQFPYTN